jgi:ATPase subunit of ABC transporter with duplicated ATPase domains
MLLLSNYSKSCFFQLHEWDMMFYQAEALDLEKTVLDTVADAAEDWKLDDIKGLLGRCNFRDDMLDRKVQFLSGGEKVMCIFSTVTPHKLPLYCV